MQTRLAVRLIIILCEILMMYFFIFNSFSKFYFFIYENNIVFVLLCGVWYSVWSCFVVRCIYVTVMRSDAEWDSGSVL